MKTTHIEICTKCNKEWVILIDELFRVTKPSIICPHCGFHHETIADELREKYKMEGN